MLAQGLTAAEPPARDWRDARARRAQQLAELTRSPDELDQALGRLGRHIHRDLFLKSRC